MDFRGPADVEQEVDLRQSDERRQDERRQDVPDSLKPFLGELVPEERRLDQRRQRKRRTKDES